MHIIRLLTFVAFRDEENEAPVADFKQQATQQQKCKTRLGSEVKESSVDNQKTKSDGTTHKTPLKTVSANISGKLGLGCGSGTCLFPMRMYNCGMKMFKSSVGLLKIHVT